MERTWDHIDVARIKKLAVVVAAFVWETPSAKDIEAVEDWIATGDPEAVALVTAEDAAAQYREDTGIYE